MECNNKYCTWCMYESCCHEDEQGGMTATPNMLDCPSSLRVDHQEGLFEICDKLKDELEHMSFKELRKVDRFISLLRR